GPVTPFSRTSVAPPALHSFPTRRSSDLTAWVANGGIGPPGRWRGDVSPLAFFGRWCKALYLTRGVCGAAGLALWGPAATGMPWWRTCVGLGRMQAPSAGCAGCPAAQHATMAFPWQQARPPARGPGTTAANGVCLG